MKRFKGMRKQKQLDGILENQKVTLKEVRMKEAKLFAKKIGEFAQGGTPEAMIDVVTDILPSISTLTPEQAEDLSMGDMEIIMDAFTEVNAAFLRILKKTTGIDLLSLETEVEKVEAEEPKQEAATA